MYCSKCGTQLSDDSNFCTVCGAPVHNSNSSSQQVRSQNNMSTTNVPPLYPKQPKNVLKACLIICCSAILITVIAVAGVLIVKNQNNSYLPIATAPTGTPTDENAVDATPVATDKDDTATPEPTEEAFKSNLGGIEGEIQEQIMSMNSSSYNAASIDVYAENYKPGTRNSTFSWNDSVFYCLEGYREYSGYQNKDLCSLQKKELINKANGNIIQYDIYINTATQVANKIVAIEYTSNGLEVTEYYFDNNKKVSFIFQYTTDNYVSSYATPDKAGDRYLFANDCLVTWRSIHGSTVNYVIGQNEADRMNGQFAKSTIQFFSELSADKQNIFNAKELKMINAAYNTYEVVMNTEGIAHIQGYVYNEQEKELAGATVEIYSSDFTKLIFTTTTDAQGKYFVYVPNREYEYNILIKMEGKTEVRIYAVKMSASQIGAFQNSVYLFDSSNSTYQVQLTLGDAFNYASNGNGMVRLSGATVNFRAGINNKVGDILQTIVASGDGILSTNLPAGVYTIEVTASGYETMYYVVVVSSIRTNIYEYYAPPHLNENEYAVVLTWGERPSDLDSHLFTTTGNSTDHIWFGNESDSNGSFLDVDDTSSYGPETTTIRQFSTNSYYKYCVVDYTNCSGGNYSSTEMSYSGACVNVYSSQGLIASYSVPAGSPGVIWEIFEIRNGNIYPIQRYYNNVSNKTWWNSDK